MLIFQLVEQICDGVISSYVKSMSSPSPHLPSQVHVLEDDVFPKFYINLSSCPAFCSPLILWRNSRRSPCRSLAGVEEVQHSLQLPPGYPGQGGGGGGGRASCPERAGKCTFRGQYHFVGITYCCIVLARQCYITTFHR